MTEGLWGIFTSDRVNQVLNSAAAEIPKVVTSLIVLGMGWYIGKRLTLLWSYRQKRNEQDLIAARDFHAQYGEFFSLWKLWNYYIRDVGADALPGASRWEILDRACRAEARLESTLVRLASERVLTNEEIATLGRFRQRYQQLRETIRDNKPLMWDHSEHPEYVEFKKLGREPINGGQIPLRCCVATSRQLLGASGPNLVASRRRAFDRCCRKTI